MSTAAPLNSRRRVLFASLAGTTIEFYDFYIYATAAVLVFPVLFFPASEGATATLQSLATFALAFFARPLGSALFGHFGDRIGRKVTLVAALLTMGISTIAIGLLPTYAQIGIAAPIMLAVCRFGQGLGLGGEWGGAVLLATENAPPGKRAWYGMFPQLGAPLGFILAGSSFLLLDYLLDNSAFMSWGWRIPFLASALLVIVGLYVRLKIHETPAFQKTLDSNARVKLPMATVFRHHSRMIFLGTVAALATFVLFYLTTVFSLTWGTRALGYSRETFLSIQLVAVLFFAAFIPIAALLADRLGRRRVMIGVSVSIALYGLLFNSMLVADNILSVTLFLALGLALMGMTYGPLGTQLSELFPTAVRYTGASFCFNFAGIFGASLAPYIATWLAEHYSIAAVGWYLLVAAALTTLALLFIGETKDHDLDTIR